MRVASLHIHPVKGMRAVDATRAQIGPRGPAGDRRWLVVDRTGLFLTQRSHPVLATLTASLDGDALLLTAPGGAQIRIDRPDGAARRRVTVWDSTVDAASAGEEAARAVSALIGEAAELVFMDERAHRESAREWTGAPSPVSFADGFPILMTTTGSLNALNDEIERNGGARAPMARFRPNLVIDCAVPWAEDGWRRLEIGGVILDLVKPCARCIVTTTDQATGERMGKEPLATLARIRRSRDPRVKGAIFGVNAVPKSTGEIAVGDSVSAS